MVTSLNTLNTTYSQQDEPVKNILNELKVNDKLKQNVQKSEILQSKLDEKTTKYHDSLDKIAAFNNQLGNKDDIIDKFQQQSEKLERLLTRKYQNSQDKLISILKYKEEFIKKLESKLGEEKISKLDEEKS
ncbi:hypothetical protein C1646_729828, partial [Rhizophagus diaphanus]